MKKLTCKISEFSFCPISVVGLLQSLLQRNTFWFLERFGVPGGIRTPDLQVRSLPFYPTKLQAHVKCVFGMKFIFKGNFKGKLLT